MWTPRSDLPKNWFDRTVAYATFNGAETMSNRLDNCYERLVLNCIYYDEKTWSNKHELIRMTGWKLL
ncbi:uncharacterized protein G2W53_022260 [Senna tora]|uniref:Uncharacterized protein n=1 Tax=Senna tora TaxID=362788 RepID=A0A834TNB0_9FABA|nr:uncharacterized protein G2W53_022260 [Senna tora]